MKNTLIFIIKLECTFTHCICKKYGKI